MAVVLVRFGACLVGMLAAAPAVAAEPVASAEPQARVHVEIAPREAALVRQLPSVSHAPDSTALQQQGYDWVCSGKCELVLPPGQHTFALTTDAKSVVSPSKVDVPAGHSTLRAEYHKGSTTWGWVLIGTSPVTWYGSLMLMSTINGGKAVDGTQIGLGTVIAVTQLVVGVAFVASPGGSTTLTIVPTGAAPARSRFGVERAIAGNQLGGLGVQLAF